MTEDEARKAAQRLADQGWTGMGGGEQKPPQFVQSLADQVKALKGILETSLEEKQAQVVTLQEQLHKLKHGGGR